MPEKTFSICSGASKRSFILVSVAAMMKRYASSLLVALAPWFYFECLRFVKDISFVCFAGTFAALNILMSLSLLLHSVWGENFMEQRIWSGRTGSLLFRELFLSLNLYQVFLNNSPSGDLSHDHHPSHSLLQSQSNRPFLQGAYAIDPIFQICRRNFTSQFLPEAWARIIRRLPQQAGQGQSANRHSPDFQLARERINISRQAIGCAALGKTTDLVHQAFSKPDKRNRGVW